MPIWRSRCLRSQKSWASAWSATSYSNIGSLLGQKTNGSDREASTTKFYCTYLSCWSWLWLRSTCGSISFVCGIGNVVGLSYPAWGHSWPFRYQSMPIEAITPIWYLVVAMVGQIVPVTYWWSCVAYCGLLKVAKSVTGSFFSRLGRF